MKDCYEYDKEGHSMIIIRGEGNDKVPTPPTNIKAILPETHGFNFVLPHTPHTPPPHPYAPPTLNFHIVELIIFTAI